MEAPASRPRAAVTCLAGMGLGALMLMAGVGWSALASPATVWSPQQAEEHQAAGEALHAARRSAAPAAASPEDATASSAELATAQARFDKIDAELAHAQTSRQRTGAWLVRAGLGTMILCGVGYLSLRSG